MLEAFIVGGLAGAALMALAAVVMLAGVLERLIACNRALAHSVAKACAADVEAKLEQLAQPVAEELRREFRAEERETP